MPLPGWQTLCFWVISVLRATTGVVCTLGDIHTDIQPFGLLLDLFLLDVL